MRALSPSAGDRPNSSTPPPAAVTISSLPAANSDSAGRSSVNVNMAAGAASGSASVLPPTCAAPETKSNGQSYASAAAVPVSPPPGIKPPAPFSFSFITPVLPAASPAPHHPPSYSFAASSPPLSSAAAPTFIAPIAPSPTAAQGFTRPFSPLTALPRSPSPLSPSPTLSPPAAQPKEAPPAHTGELVHSSRLSCYILCR